MHLCKKFESHPLFAGLSCGFFFFCTCGYFVRKVLQQIVSGRQSMNTYLSSLACWVLSGFGMIEDIFVSEALFVSFYWVKASLCNSGLLRTHRDPHVCASRVPELKVWASTLCFYQWFSQPLGMRREMVVDEITAGRTPAIVSSCAREETMEARVTQLSRYKMKRWLIRVRCCFNYPGCFGNQRKWE